MKIYILLFLFTFLVINFGCDSTTEPGTEKILKGIVKDAQGNLLSDVKVFIIYDYGQGTGTIQSRSSFNRPFGLTGVDLYSFTAVLFNSGAKLDWVTLSELNNTGFEIERKTSNSDWEVVGFVVGVGTTTDTSYYSFTDRNMEAGIYWYRLKIIEFNANYEYSPEVQFNFVFVPLVSVLEQNYPNPFDISTNIGFELRKTAHVKIDICSFKDKTMLFNLVDYQANAGKHELLLGTFDSLPSNGYKVLMKIQESDSTYTLEKNIIQTFSYYDQSILSSIPNAISKSGSFEIEYDDIPFGQNFYLTGEADPTPLGEFRLRNNLKLVIYKPGFKVVQKDVAINLDEGQEIEIQLEEE